MTSSFRSRDVTLCRSFGSGRHGVPRADGGLNGGAVVERYVSEGGFRAWQGNRNTFAGSAKKIRQTEEKLTVPRYPSERRNHARKAKQQSDKTASETDKNVEPDGSEGKGENNG